MRKAKAITMDEFITRLNELFSDSENGPVNQDTVDFIARDIIEDDGQACKDISKVRMSDENLTFADAINCDDVVFGAQYIKYANGKKLPVIIGAMGGDWEQPVVFVLYIDHNNKLRGYVPENGNHYCKKYKCAYGSVGEWDELKPEDERLDEDEFYRLYSGEEEGQLYNYEEIKKDIQNRIMLV